MTSNSLHHLKEQDKQARRDMIIDAAERVFAEKPFSKVSIRDIAREAGISHALIYHYFPDQQTLFVEAFLRGAQAIIDTLRQELDAGSDFGEVAGRFVTYLAEHDQYFRMMAHFMLDGNLSGDGLERLNDMERRLFDQFERLFAGSMAKADARLFSHALFASLNGILITFRDYPGRDREEVRRHMLNICRVVAERFRPAGQPSPLLKRGPGTRE